MKYLLSGHNNPANSAVLIAPEYCARRVRSRNRYLLKDILLDILGTIVVGFSELGNTIPLRARVHKLNIDTHMPILEDVDDIVKVLLGPAHFNTCQAQEPVSTRTATKRVVEILDAKYKKAVQMHCHYNP